MKIRILFLKRKYIYLTLIIVMVMSLLLIFSKFNNSSPAFNTIKDNTTINEDLTGDGKKDILYVKTDKDKYYLQILSNGRDFYLEPNRKLGSMGLYTSYNPLKVTLMDVSRDKTPEIFIQSYQNTTPIQHIFLWNNNNFEDIFCNNTNNFLGFLDSKNNKTPKILSGKVKDNKIEFSNYILIGNKLENFDFECKDTFMGKDTIFAFIKYIESLPEGEAYKPKDIFYPGLSGKDIATIGRLSGENNIYTFQNAVFMDNKWDKDGEISQIKWSLSFKGISKTNKDEVKNYTLNVYLKPFKDSKDFYFYKINSISLE